MKMTLSTHHAAHLLASDENGGWSYSGATALVEHLEELEDGTDEEIELDTVALRCEYSEHESLESWIVEYYGMWARPTLRESLKASLKAAGIDLEGDEEAEEVDDLIRSHVQDHGQLIEFDGGIIVSSF